jgi:hypothetical protein
MLKISPCCKQGVPVFVWKVKFYICIADKPGFLKFMKIQLKVRNCYLGVELTWKLLKKY